jgi:hypothetical protein
MWILAPFVILDLHRHLGNHVPGSFPWRSSAGSQTPTGTPGSIRIRSLPFGDERNGTLERLAQFTEQRVQVDDGGAPQWVARKSLTLLVSWVSRCTSLSTLQVLVVARGSVFFNSATGW